MIAVDPPEHLDFKRPFTAIVKEYITITNKNSLAPLAFKVKTTAPKMYCVRPNTGKLAPGQSTQVQVFLQAMQSDPPIDTKCKDKFLIQALKISQEVMDSEGDELTSTLLSLWQQADEQKKIDPDHVDEIKLRCVFLPADESADLISSNADFVALDDGRQNGFGIHEPLVPKIDSVHGLPVRTRNLSSANSALISPIVTLSEQEIADLKVTIKKLSDRCSEYKADVDRLNSLRSRAVKESTSNANSSSIIAEAERKRDMLNEGFRNKQAQLEGVPIQTVALIGLLCFLFGVLFF